MVEMSFLGKNLEALKRFNPHVREWLDKNSEKAVEVRAKISKNKNGITDISVGPGFLMENFSLNSYQIWLRDRDVKVYIVIGTNLGYGLNLILEKADPSTKVLVLEPSAEILFACLGLTDYSPFIKQNRLAFLHPDINFLNKFLSQLELYIFHSKIKILVDIPSSTIGPEYEHWGKRIKEILADMKLNVTTTKKIQEEVVKNEMENFSSAFSDGSLLPLKCDSMDLQAIILGAGPSLEHYIGLLKEFEDSALFLTSFQTLPALEGFGFTPSLSMLIDYSKNLIDIYKRVDSERLKNIPLIYSVKASPGVVRRYPGPRFPIWTIGGLGTYIKDHLDIVIDSGGNVCVALIRLFKLFGIKKFFLVGQDFAWVDSKTHVSGHHANKLQFRYDPKIHARLKNRRGETIYSTASHLSAARKIEQEIKNSDIKVYNLYGGGVNIVGTIEITWDEIKDELSNNTQKSKLTSFLKELALCRKPRPIPALPLQFKAWNSSLNHVQKRLEKLFKKPSKNALEINATFREIYLFLNQHPLYQPYISNDIAEMAKMAFIKSNYSPADFVYTKKIIKNIKRKTREMDTALSVAAGVKGQVTARSKPL
ncbi:MAG: motility associated factor glycosyltransferase family protein [Deltaproteobacteria bacterium]|nr:motility associated factor glycosyltransferase family protein [Deltaproteobacteria bacterium]